MTEDGTIPFYERFHPYSKPELLQLASYLAQHDVAFNNLPVYSTEEGDGDDGNIEIQEPKSSAKKEKPKNAPVRPPIRSHSPPVRDTGIDVPPRKPLYAPTERQLNAAKASHLRQLINKSKTALLKLDREILAERSDLSLNEQKDRIGPSVAQRHLKCPMAPTGVLKPKVRVLGDKGARKIRRPASGKWVTKAISPTLHQCSRHAFDPRSSRDAKILSIYLQRLALEKSFQGQEDSQLLHVNQPKKPKRGSADLNVPHNYIKTSAIHYEQQYPPGLIAFLEKWGSKLDNSSYKGVRRPQVHFTNNGQLESSTESVSNSTDSISEFIQRHANHNKPPQKLRSRSTESKSDLLKSTNALKSRKTSVERNSSRMISELKEGGTPYRILRLPVEQYQQLLARSKTEVVVKADRFNYENLLPFHKSERPAGIVQICDSLSEEIVNACVEASANLVDNLSNEVINELLRSELAVSTSSSWSSFSGISEFPQKMRPSDVKQLILPVPSKSKIQPPTSKKHSIGKLTLQMPNQTGLKTLNPVKELTAPTNLSVPENKSQDFVLDGDLLARTSEIRSVISHSPDQEQIVAGDGSLIKRSSKERSVVERFSTPEEVRLKSSTSDIIQIKSINGGTLIKNASSNGSNSSPPSRVSSRKGSERGELVSLKKSFSQGYLVSIENHQTPTSRLQSQVTVGQNSLKSTLLQGVLTPKEMSPPKSVMLHDKPSSFDLITSLAGPLTPDTPTSKDNTTQETVPSLNGSSQFYEDDFESTEGIDSN